MLAPFSVERELERDRVFREKSSSLFSSIAEEGRVVQDEGRAPLDQHHT